MNNALFINDTAATRIANACVALGAATASVHKRFNRGQIIGYNVKRVSKDGFTSFVTEAELEVLA